MQTGKRVSLREIARICNVSPTTVSRIANGIGSFSEETRRLVLDTMAREGYSVESPGSLPANPAKPIVGCLVADFTNEVFSNRLAYIDNYFREKGMMLCACETHRDPVKEAELIQQFCRLGAVGILVIAAIRGMQCEPQPIPVVYMDHTMDELRNPDTYCVSSDDYIGGRLAAQELYRKGCTNPLILNIRYVPYWDSQRIQGFIRGFEEQGVHISKESILQPELNKTSFDSAKDLITYHWTKGTDFDCVFGASDWRAYGALVALNNLGVRVPEDVKIVGYDGIRVSRYCETPITTIQQNTELLSLTACDMMWKLINGETVEQHQVLVPIRLREGKTT